MAAAAASVLIASAAQATSFSPTFEEFDLLPGATFGGTGIPNDPTAFSTFTGVGGDLLTIGLIATQRFSNPVLSNDGAGTYTATNGSNFGGAGQSSVEGALWNFGFYASIENKGGNSVLSDYDLKLYYDFDPGEDTPTVDLGVSDINGALAAADFADGTTLFSSLTEIQRSENLLFGYLAASFPTVQDAPAFTPFNASATGEYTFAVEVGSAATANAVTGDRLVSINVNVVPVPVALPMLLSAFGIAALVRRRARSV
ncbi:MAG: hypothetical protein AAFU61_05950 [Pseudomonadota bacterium]